MIILNLPMEVILATRSVNKFWNAAVFSSLPIKRKLFLAAEPKTNTWMYKAESRSIGRYDGGEVKMSDGKAITARVNDMLFNPEPGKNRRLHDRLADYETTTFLKVPDLANTESLGLKMFICQPPSTRVDYMVHYDDRDHVDPCDPREANGIIERDTGVRLGGVLDVSLAKVGAISVESFSKSHVVRPESCDMLIHGVVFESDENMERQVGPVFRGCGRL